MTRSPGTGTHGWRDRTVRRGNGHRSVARGFSAVIIATIVGYAALVVFLTRISRAVDDALELFETVDDELRR